MILDPSSTRKLWRISDGSYEQKLFHSFMIQVYKIIRQKELKTKYFSWLLTKILSCSGCKRKSNFCLNTKTKTIFIMFSILNCFFTLLSFMNDKNMQVGAELKFSVHEFEASSLINSCTV